MAGVNGECAEQATRCDAEEQSAGRVSLTGGLDGRITPLALRCPDTCILLAESALHSREEL